MVHGSSYAFSIEMLLAVDKPVGCTSHVLVRNADAPSMSGASAMPARSTPWHPASWWWAWARLLVCWACYLDTKSYVADISFGAETNTDDAEGEAVRTVAVANEFRDPAYAREHLAAMLGPQMQVPPAFSAISVNGVRAYKSAREGNAVDLPPRPVEVYAADLIAVGGEGDTCVWTVAFSVSKGTYIRLLPATWAAPARAPRTFPRCTARPPALFPLALVIRSRSFLPSLRLALPWIPLRPWAPRVLTCRDLADDLLCGRRIPVERALADFYASKAPFALVLDGELKALARIEGGRFVMEHVFPQAIGGVR